MSVPTEITLVEIQEEIQAASAWCERKGLNLEWYPDKLEVRLALCQKNSGEFYYLKGLFYDYKEEPPIWVFTDENWSYTKLTDQVDKTNFPKGEPTDFGSSIFHPNAVICAPFNRLAYKIYKGPHADWGTTAQWLLAARDYVTGDTIGDMLSIIYRDFIYTKKRLQ